MKTFSDIGPVGLLLLLPFLLLALWAIVDVIRRPASRMRYLPKWAWVLIVVLGNTLGQLVYLIVGRDTTKPAEQTVGASVDTARSAADALYGSRGGEGEGKSS